MKTIAFTFLALGSVVLAAGPVQDPAIEVADVFGSGMVLQRDVAVPVWGKADPRAKVSVSFGGRRGLATADANGRWEVHPSR